MVFFVLSYVEWNSPETVNNFLIILTGVLPIIISIFQRTSFKKAIKISIILFSISFLSSLLNNNQLNNYISIFIIVLVGISFIQQINEINKLSKLPVLKKWIGFIFLFFFSILFFKFVLSGLNLENDLLQNFVLLTSKFEILLITTTSITGIIFVRTNLEFAKKIQSDFKKEKRSEKKRSEFFKKKFPKISKFPLIGKILDWIYKEGLRYSISLMILLAIFSGLALYKLGESEIRGDEFQVVAASVGYYKTGEFYKWDWLENKSGKYTECIENDKYCHYKRAWPHTFLITQSYKIFGISEWSSRIVSVISGIIFVIIIYFFTKFFFESKDVATLSTFALVFNANFLSLFRYTRMYALLLPMFLILLYFLYRTTTEPNKTKIKNKRLSEFIKNNFDFRLTLIPITLIILFFAYNIHMNSLVAFPSLVLFIFYMFYRTREIKFLWTSLAGLSGIIFLFTGAHLGIIKKFTQFLTFFEKSNYSYIYFQSNFPFGESLGISLFLVFLFSITLIKKKSLDKIFFIIINVLFSLAFFVWIADRYPNFVYGSHIIPLSITIIVAGFYCLIKTTDKKLVKSILFFMFLTLVLSSFLRSKDDLYGENGSRAKLKIAYKEINENFNSQKDIIFGQYLRTFYLKEIENAKTINMLSGKKYDFENFLDDLSKHKSGYITWETKKGGHLQDAIKEYCCENFKQLHGESCLHKIDDTKVEVFYFEINK